VLGFATILEPVAGPRAQYFFGLGLLGAGLTSAMTAPLAAAAGIQELFGWPEDTRNPRYRAVWLSVLITGLLFGLTGWSPLNAIIAAQAANGILLPVMVGFMLYLAFRQQALPFPMWYKGLGLLIMLVCTGLGIRTLWWVWSQF
jgi:Mn2+/Fe2+ NRAMP family transporter